MERPSAFFDKRHLHDTLEASCWCITFADNYVAGQYAPHYPVPAIKYARQEVRHDGFVFAFNPYRPWWLTR